MPLDLSEIIVIGVSSRSLFNLERVNDIGKLTAAPLDAQVNFEIVDNSSNIRFDKISRIMLNLIIKKKKLKNAFIFRWRKQ